MSKFRMIDMARNILATNGSIRPCELAREWAETTGARKRGSSRDQFGLTGASRKAVYVLEKSGVIVQTEADTWQPIGEVTKVDWQGVGRMFKAGFHPSCIDCVGDKKYRLVRDGKYIYEPRVSHRGEDAGKAVLMNAVGVMVVYDNGHYFDYAEIVTP